MDNFRTVFFIVLGIISARLVIRAIEHNRKG